MAEDPAISPLTRNGTSRPVPDPTDLTREAIEGVVSSLTQYIDGQVATLNMQINGLESVVGVKFEGVTERFSASKEAVAAALTAQKEAARETNASNTLAISKSETASQDTINKLADLFHTTIDGVSSKVDDIKERVSRIESTKVGATENRTGLYAAIAVVGTILGIVIATISIAAIVLR